jgi:transposase
MPIIPAGRIMVPHRLGPAGRGYGGTCTMCAQSSPQERVIEGSAQVTFRGNVEAEMLRRITSTDALEERGLQRGLAGKAGQESPARRGHRRFPVAQNHWRRRHRARLRPGQEMVERSKRHLLVDTEGLVLGARVHSAKVLDQDGIRLLLEPILARFGRLSHLWVDAGYQGSGILGGPRRLVGLERGGGGTQAQQASPREGGTELWALGSSGPRRERRWIGRSSCRPRVFRVLPRRWVVERTFAWISHNRRMAKDYERLCATGEAFSSTRR